MEIITRFAIGGKVWTVRDCKAIKFEIKYVRYDGGVYYGETCNDVIPESQCFATIEELVAYVTSESDDVSSTAE